jgi:hypothetical protein
MAMPQGSQAALNHSRPSLVLMRQSPLISPQQGHVFIGFSVIGLGGKDCEHEPGGGKGGRDPKDDSWGLAPAEYRDQGEKCHGENDD